MPSRRLIVLLERENDIGGQTDNGLHEISRYKQGGYHVVCNGSVCNIRLETEFVYLAAVLDAYSRRIIGWALDRHLEDDLAITALKMAPTESVSFAFQGVEIAYKPEKDDGTLDAAIPKGYNLELLTADFAADQGL